MAEAAIFSKGVVLLLSIHYLVFCHCLCGFCVWSLFCYVVLSCNHLDGEERAD